MQPERRSTPAWLFSFVDLAFLLLIAMTQLGGTSSFHAPNLGEILVPRVGDASVSPIPIGSRNRAQLRIHPVAGDALPPFELAGTGTNSSSPDGAEDSPVGTRIGLVELRDRLGFLRQSRTRKPLLAPHEDSRSGDLLSAVGLLEEYWPSQRRAIVAPVSAPPPPR